MGCWDKDECECEWERVNEWEACDDEGDVGDAGGGGDEAVVVMIGWGRECACA